MINSVFAQTAKDTKNTNAVLEVAQAEFLQSEENTSFYLDGDKILKVVIEAPEKIDTRNAVRNTDGTMTATADVNVKVYESAPLSADKISLARAGELIKSDEATNPMGNVRAKLSVKYSWTSYGSPNLLRLVNATSSYKILIAEGVRPQTSSLRWSASGVIYKNGVFSKNGTIGNNTNYSKPTFSNVTLMPSSQSIDPITAGVTYTLNCTRGVTINIYLPIV